MKTNQSIKYSIGLIFSALLISCNSNPKKEITKKQDYQKYLTLDNSSKRNEIEKEIQFWQTKYTIAPNQPTYLVKIANQYTNLFETNAQIKNLYKAEELLLEANKKLFEKSSEVMRAIARNYITQHKFKEALNHLKKAYQLGEKKKETEKMLFDVHMELGNYKLAYSSLNKIRNTKDFDYLIRAAKWNDHNGRLDYAISLMEEAKKRVETKENKALKVWVYSNLADFYGHDGRIEDSYAFYLKTLELDNSNSYALKGIAWIAFSHERNTKKANEIITFLERKNKIPDLFLLKAEIAEFDKNEFEKEKAIESFISTLSQNEYGDMYNKYKILLMVENKNQIDNAIFLAKEEVQNRPTPESFDLLAWSYYKKGDLKKALEIAQKHTLNKSFEPSILLHNAIILKSNKYENNTNEMKAELIASLYELGPSAEIEINRL